MITLVKVLEANGRHADLAALRFGSRMDAAHVIEEVLADHSRMPSAT